MDRFLIAPYDNGLQLDIKPFMIPDNAFAQLDNAYVFRGRVRKRFGARLMDESVDSALQPLRSRLRYQVGVLGGGSVLAANVNCTAHAIGQMFSVGDISFTVFQDAAGFQNMLRSDGSAEVAQYCVAAGGGALAGDFTITIAAYPAGTPVYFYPALPVMGFAEYQIGHSIDNPTFAFDTCFSYEYLIGGWSRIDATAWTGNDHQFFWSTNWQGDTPSDTLLFTTNYNAADGITWYDQIVGNWVRNTAAQWRFYTNKTGTTDYLKTARIILPFKDHLVAFNTIESINGAELTFFNRARWCQNGSPLEQDGIPEVIAWREDIPGRGGWSDCPCKEPIITAQFLRDRLIVYFESSTWEFVYTGNQILPFTWQQINTELGAKATMSQVPFDKVVLGVGNVGIHACNGTQVERIDSSIPDEVFKINNDNNGPERVCGIRDYYTEMVYWSMEVPTYQLLATYKYPNRILVYNYRNSSWAFNDDSITAFGYFYAQQARTWASMGMTWDDCADTWGSGELADLPKLIVAGNQEGYTFFIDVTRTRNAPSLQITNITNPGGVFTVMNHNLPANSYVLIENCAGMTQMNGNIYQAVVLDEHTFTLDNMPALGADIYLGQGTITRVSKIDILTKQFNFYLKNGANTSVNKVDFLVNREPVGPNALNPQMYIECYPTYSQCPLVSDGSLAGCLLGNSMLELTPYPSIPLEGWQDQLWHPVYFQNEGASIQFHITWTEEQMTVIDYVLSDFQLNAMLIHTRPTTSRLY